MAKKTLTEIRKFDDETVAFDLDESNLFFKVGARTLISRIIESKFPNYQAVIPKDNPGRLVVGRAELADAIRRVSLLSAERSKGIKFTIEKNRMRLFSSNPEIGEARDRLAVEYKGQDLEIGFNAQYLLDFLTAVGVGEGRLRDQGREQRRPAQAGERRGPDESLRPDAHEDLRGPLSGFARISLLARPEPRRPWERVPRSPPRSAGIPPSPLGPGGAEALGLRPAEDSREAGSKEDMALIRKPMRAGFCGRSGVGFGGEAGAAALGFITART